MFVVVSTSVTKTSVNDDSNKLFACFVQSVHNTKNEAVDEIRNNCKDAVNLIGDIWLSKNSNSKFKIIECDNKFGWNLVTNLELNSIDE